MKNYETIKENRVFQKLYKRGKYFVGKTLVTYVGYEMHGSVRMGITTGKKVGNSVCRVRARRVIREAFRLLAPNVKKNVNLVFVARGKTPFVKSTDVFAEMSYHLKKAGILEEHETEQISL